MMHNYYLKGRIELLNLRSAFIWMFNKIKPLWILHILLTFICINSTYITYENINKFGVELILDIFMIKEWLPFRNAGMLNGGVSWYLCSVVVCYLIFPLFLYYAEKMYTKKVSTSHVGFTCSSGNHWNYWESVSFSNENKQFLVGR